MRYQVAKTTRSIFCGCVREKESARHLIERQGDTVSVWPVELWVKSSAALPKFRKFLSFF